MMKKTAVTRFHCTQAMADHAVPHRLGPDTRDHDADRMSPPTMTDAHASRPSTRSPSVASSSGAIGTEPGSLEAGFLAAGFLEAEANLAEVGITFEVIECGCRFCRANEAALAA